MLKRFIRPSFSFIKNVFKLQQSLAINNSYTQTLHSKSLLMTNKFTFSEDKNGKTPSQQFKDQSKQFYEKYVDNIIELQKSEDWPMVVGNTAEPLIIDFYADWCGPCKKLTPILQQKINQSKGKYKLLKVNIDKCGQVAHQLKITSVPTVFAVFRGNGVDSFQGVPEQAKLKQFFETLQKISNLASAGDKAVEALTEGKQLMNQKKFNQAEQLLSKMPTKGVQQQIIAIKQIFVAQCLLSTQKIAKFKDQLQIIKKYQKHYIQNPELVDFYKLIIEQGERIVQMSNNIPQVEQLKKKIIENQKDFAIRFELSQVYKEKEMMEESLQTLLEILKLDRNWEEKKANKAMLEIFKQLGNASPLTQKYRKLMQRALY